MNWRQEYKEKIYSPTEAVLRVVKSGDCIYANGSTIAISTINALFEVIDNGELSGIFLNMHSPVNGKLELDKYNFSREQLVWPTFFMNPPDRSYREQGKATFMPLQYGMYSRYTDYHKTDVCILVMTPPDENGYCNIGPYGFAPKPLCDCERIIAQFSEEIPWVNGTAHTVHVSRINAIVDLPEALPVLDNHPANEVEEKIASNILDYIPNGACIQLGIGGIANAVGFGLRDRKHLGIHTEVLTESMVDLIEAGVVDNSMKTHKPGVSTIGFVHGSTRQNKFVNRNEKILFEPFEDIVNIRNIASNKNMISINAAISVDTTGQVCAESIGFRQYSGTGGQLDFVRGASLSEGGCSFIVFPSTVKSKDGSIKSRIVTSLSPGSIVTTPRTDVQYIATEFGCVNVMFEDVYTRVKRLISIAHPDFREELLFDAKKNGLII